MVAVCQANNWADVDSMVVDHHVGLLCGSLQENVPRNAISSAAAVVLDVWRCAVITANCWAERLGSLFDISKVMGLPGRVARCEFCKNGHRKRASDQRQAAARSRCERARAAWLRRSACGIAARRS